METDILLRGTAAILALIAIYYCQRHLSSPRVPLPPGPTPLPIIGNLHQVPVQFQQYTFAQWTHTYGDVVFVRVLGKPTIILGSLQATQDLLEKRSAKYSDRPRAVMLHELAGMHDDLAMLPYGEDFRKHRRWFHGALLDKATLSSYIPLQRKEVINFLSGLIETPDAFITHVKRFNASMILSIAYGYPVASTDDELVVLINHANEGVIATGPAGATIVDFFPILKYLPAWLPGAGFKRRALQVRKLIQEINKRPFDMVKSQIDEGKAKPSLVAKLIEQASEKGILSQEQDSIMGAGAMLYTAATDTTNTVLLSFLLAMVLYPDVYRKAQEEVDHVVGVNRLPDLSDLESLPYLECVLKETYRWNCPVPLGVPHRLMEDDEYRGYYIPRGSTVIANLWNMTQDPEYYPQPGIFRPERFQETDASAGAPDPRDIIFGHGRRICPGRLIAESSILLMMANILSICDIQAPKDAAGKLVFPVPKFLPGMTSHPDEFSCKLTPRSQESIDVVMKAKIMI